MEKGYTREYYENYDLGEAGVVNYIESPHIRSFMTGVAHKIVEDLHPDKTLDAGCALGVLVAELRKKGVEAYGLDFSEYAIKNADPIARSHCFQGSLADEFPKKLNQHYDLITCIEVLEHMSEEDGRTAVRNLCQLTDTIIFCSTPEDFEEPTHINVRPRQYWARLFAENGFFDDVFYRPLYLAPYAVCYRRRESFAEQIDSYEKFIQESDEKVKGLLEVVNQQRTQICYSVFFKDKEDFREANSQKFFQYIENHYATNIVVSEDINIPSGCREIRLDPCEGDLCVISNLRIIFNGELLPFQPRNGFILDNLIVFPTEDPQISITLPDDNGLMLRIDYQIRLYPARDILFRAFGVNLAKKEREANDIKSEYEARLTAKEQELLEANRDWETRLEAKEQELLETNRDWEIRLRAKEQELLDTNRDWETRLRAKEQGLLETNRDWETRLRAREQELLETNRDWEARLEATEHEKNKQIEEIRRAYRQQLIDHTEKSETKLRETKDRIASLNNSILEKDQYIGSVVMIADDRLDQINRLNEEKQQITQRCEYAEQEYSRISQSSFWKLTKPGRVFLDGVKSILQKDQRVYLALLCIKWRISFGKAEMEKRKTEYIAWNNISQRRVERGLSEKHKGIPQAEFLTECFGQNVFKKESRYTHECNHSFQKNYKISILVPLYNTTEYFLRDMIMSVQSQTYQNWELCLADGSDDEHSYVGAICKSISRRSKGRIKYRKLKCNLGISENTNGCISMATGSYVALLDHDDMLHPSALYEAMEAIVNQGADLIYTDETHFHQSPADSYNPHYKPDFSPDTLRSYNYICHFTVFSRSLLEKAGKFRSEFDGSQDYDIILRLTELAERIIHIPKILYYWRSHENSVASDFSAKPYTVNAAKSALAAHLERVHLHGKVSDSSVPTTYHIQYEIEGKPLISIIIPNKDHIEDLAKCITSIRETSTWQNWEIIIVENNSVEDLTFVYYREICETDERIRMIRWKGAFNFSAICNYGAKAANGEYLLMLNNDTEVITPDWMEQMLMFAQRKDVGAVGAMLYYPDNTIQHAGVILGLGSIPSMRIAGHSHKYFRRGEFGYASRLTIAQNLSAVTAACMLMRKNVFEEVNGFDEGFAVAFNDVDLCMKIRKAGFLIVWTPYAEMYHYESKSRGAEDTIEKQQRFAGEIERFKMKWSNELQAGDPYYNPNLTLSREDFSIEENATI